MISLCRWLNLKVWLTKWVIQIIKLELCNPRIVVCSFFSLVYIFGQLTANYFYQQACHLCSKQPQQVQGRVIPRNLWCSIRYWKQSGSFQGLGRSEETDFYCSLHSAGCSRDAERSSLRHFCRESIWIGMVYGLSLRKNLHGSTDKLKIKVVCILVFSLLSVDQKGRWVIFIL